MPNSGILRNSRSACLVLALKGRAVDHIGFESSCKKLAAEGMTFEVPFQNMPQLGLKTAFILDPVGTRIELTEGLAAR